MLCVALISIKFPYFNQIFQARGISEAINSKITVGHQQQQRTYRHTRQEVDVCAAQRKRRAPAAESLEVLVFSV
jgi:hypothetical protein